MEAIDLYRRCTLEFLDRVDQVGDDQWDAPTPCPAWSVRELVNHVVTEDRWAAPLMHGLTPDQVGDRFAGDLLGDDPVDAARRAAAIAAGAIEAEMEQRERVHLAFGDDDPDDFVRRLAVDHLLHGWDLAMATTGDPLLAPDLVAEVSAWFAEGGHEDQYRVAGAIGPPAPVHGTGVSVDIVDHLLSMTGRDREWGPNHIALARFARAMEEGDVGAAAPVLVEDCVYGSPDPTPGGHITRGSGAVCDEIGRALEARHDPTVVHVDGFVCGDRAASTWRYSWRGPEGDRRHLRCATLIDFSDGRIAEIQAYIR